MKALPVFALAAVLGYSAVASAAPCRPSSGHSCPAHHDRPGAGEEAHHGRWDHGATGVAAVKTIAGTSLQGEESEAMLGIGGLYEHTLIPHRLELEFAGAWLHSEESDRIPIDVLVKRPFHVSSWLELFAGAGPVLTLVQKAGETSAHPGALASVGSFLWGRGHLGLILELDYAVVWEEAELVQEIEGGLGVALRY